MNINGNICEISHRIATSQTWVICTKKLKINGASSYNLVNEIVDIKVSAHNAFLE